jgi:hypothetical protein
VDVLSKTIARHVLAVPDTALNATVLGAVGLLPFAAICARDRARFCRKMLRSRLAAPIAREVFLISNQAAQGLAPAIWCGYTDARLQNPRCRKPTPEDLYYIVTAHMCAAWREHDLPSMIPEVTGQPCPDPHSYARALAQQLWQQELLEKHIWKGQGMQYSADAAIEALTRQAAAEVAAGRPFAPGSATYAAMVHSYFAGAPTVEGWQLPHTALSMVGPGCSGNILILPQRKTSQLQMSAMMAGRLGRMGLSIPPFRPVDGPHVPGDPLVEADRVSAMFANFHQRVPCRRCGGMPEDTFHALTACSHPRVMAARAEAIARLPYALALMAEAAMTTVPMPLPEEAAQPQGAGQGAAQPQPAPEQPDPVPALKRLSALLHSSIQAGGWAQPLPAPHAYLLFMLLIAQPWPAYMAEAMAAEEHPAASSLLTCLAHIFDNIYAMPYRTRPLAYAWVQWAGTACYNIAVAWGDPATKVQAVAVPARAPRPRKLPRLMRPQPMPTATSASPTAAAPPKPRQAILPVLWAESRPARSSPPMELQPAEDVEDTVLLPEQPAPTNLFGL